MIYLNLSRRYFSTQVKILSDGKKAGVRPRRVRIDPKNPKVLWESTIGLEIHAQIYSQSKLFSGAKSHGASLSRPNSCVSYFDASIPGTLPVLNRRCVEAGVKTAMALNCDLNDVSSFDRKHYFYADMPAGYQITQYHKPLAVNGSIEFPTIMSPLANSKTYNHRVGIFQIQLEQDSGKTIHDITETYSRSLIDLNRAGIGLMELVFKPELFDGYEAAALVKELILVLKSIETCNCQMNNGELRVDANISVRKVSQNAEKNQSIPFGTRTEVKNLNSLRSVVKAIESEIDRQIEIISMGDEVINETRSFPQGSKCTVPMRDKEIKQDYRFMPEPNLPPLRLCETKNDAKNPNMVIKSLIRETLPKLPFQIRQEFMINQCLSFENASRLVNQPEWMHFFIDCLKHEISNYNTLANLLVLDVMNILYKKELSFEEMFLKPSMLVELANIRVKNELPLSMIHSALEILIENQYESAEAVIKEKAWRQQIESLRDPQLIEKVLDELIQKNPKVVRQIHKGKKFSLSELMRIMTKEYDGKVDLSSAGKRLKEKLKELKS